MACNSITLSNIARDCDPSLGGIKKVWLHPYVDNMFTLDASGLSVTAVSVTTGWTTYEFRRGTGSYTSTQTVDDATGANFYENELSLQFGRMESSKRTAVAALAIAEVNGIVLDNNGKYWTLAFDEAASSSGSVGQTGQAKTDSNSYQIQIKDSSKALPYEVAESVVTGLTISD